MWLSFSPYLGRRLLAAGGRRKHHDNELLAVSLRSGMTGVVTALGAGACSVVCCARRGQLVASFQRPNHRFDEAVCRSVVALRRLPHFPIPLLGALGLSGACAAVNVNLNGPTPRLTDPSCASSGCFFTAASQLATPRVFCLCDFNHPPRGEAYQSTLHSCASRLSKDL